MRWPPVRLRYQGCHTQVRMSLRIALWASEAEGIEGPGKQGLCMGQREITSSGWVPQ